MYKLPPRYCLDTTTFCTSGNCVVLIDFSPIVATNISYLSDDGHKNTNAYISPGSRYTGDENLIVVATDASFETLIWLGFNVTAEKSWTSNFVGTPSSVVLSWTCNFATSSFDLKYTSNDVKNAPVPSTVNDCANGSSSSTSTVVLMLLVVSVVISTWFALCGGLGGFLTRTLLFVCVIIVPVPRKVPVAVLANGASPVNGIITFSFEVVILNVNVPELNTTGGFGVVFAFLKKNVPSKSPQLSVFKSILSTVATAPLDAPVNFAPLTT